jgi:phage/plasmid-like protein (TIGR03299 family)
MKILLTIRRFEMSHEVETMAYAGEVPWHGLGVKVPGDLSPVQMLKKAGLDWTVEAVPSFVEFKGERISTGQKSLVRSTDGKVLSNVGEGWFPVQNEEAFEFFNDFCAAGDMSMDTAGSLKGGKMVWGLGKIKQSFELKGGDVVESYLLFSNPHEFGRCIDIRTTNIRVVCNNTLTFALQSDSNTIVRRSHRTEFDANEVKLALGIAAEKLESYKLAAEFLSSKRYTNENLIEYFGKVFPVLTTKKESRKELSKSAIRALEVVETQPGAEMNPGTWWQAFNAVTYLTNHEIGRSADNRLTSTWYGTNKNLNIKALESAIKFAEVA